jgi:hypothetical protein
LATKSSRVHIKEIKNIFRVLGKKIVSYYHLESRVVQVRIMLKGIRDTAW